MGHKKLFSGSYQYNRYKKAINEFIKEHEYNIASYGKVEKLGLR